MDILSKSDPFCVFYSEDQAAGWGKIGTTETINDSHSCKWVRRFNINERLPSSKLRFEVYDRDSQREVLKDHDFIGWVEGDILDSMLQEGKANKKIEISRDNGRGEYGMLHVILDRISKTAATYEVSLAVQVEYSVRAKLYYQLMRKTSDGSNYVPIFRSNLLEKNETEFEEASLDLIHLCAGDTSRHLRIELFHFHGMGKSKVLGFVKTSVDGLLSSQSRTPVNWSHCESGLEKARAFLSTKPDSSKTKKAFSVSIVE